MPTRSRASSCAASSTRPVSTRTSWRAVGRRGVDVVGRVELGSTCVDRRRRRRSAPRHGRRRSGRRSRTGSRAARPPTSSPSTRTSAGDAAQRVVAVPARDLGERRRPPRGRSAGKNASAAISSCGQRRLQRAERTGRRRRSCAGPRTDATSTEPPSSASTTGISAAASAWTIEPTRGAAVADRGVRDVARAPAGAAAGRRRRLGVGEDVGVPGERPDPDPVVGDRDVVQVGQRVDVDEHRRRREPHRQQRDQALAAGQHLRVPDRRPGPPVRLEGPGPAVGEGCWLHARPIPRGTGLGSCARCRHRGDR